MKTRPNWQYDEFRQVGKDYADPEEVALYDDSHARFRDVTAEAEAMLEALSLKEDDLLVEIGAGTGEFALRAARICEWVIAVDVSEAMLRSAEAKARKAGVSNIEFVHGGFLSYEHRGRQADVIVSSLALHHLPDLWKGVALTRLHRMLRRGGTFFLRDVVLDCGAEDAIRTINTFVAAQAESGGSEFGEFLRQDSEEHFREEFSTYGWIMEGLLERAGFRVLETSLSSMVMTSYLCEKV